MDNELFELCKEVFERTGWGFIDGEFEDTRNRLTSDNQIIYTSDYLLERLYSHDPAIERFNDEWLATAVRDPKGSDYGEDGATPLIALLKLTIALDEAGVKLNDQPHQ